LGLGRKLTGFGVWTSVFASKLAPTGLVVVFGFCGTVQAPASCARSLHSLVVWT
jgi:hypothetical protein